MILNLAPHLVGDVREAAPIETGSLFAPAARGWITRERAQPGHLGQPHLATAEKGETLFRVFADDVAALVERAIAWDGRSWHG